MQICKSKIEYLGHLMSGKEISPVTQKVKVFTDLALINNISEVRHIIGLIGFYRKFFPIFMQP